MTTKSKVPQIRFKGFSGEWEEKTISNLGDVVTGSTPNTLDKSNYDGRHLFVSPADIQDNRYVKNTITKLSDKGHTKGRILEENSILFVSIGSTIGKVAQILEKATTNQQINAIIPNKKYNSNFIYSLLLNKSQEIKKLASAQAVPIINKTNFSEIQVISTQDLEEQTKIGNYFQQLDKLIEQKQMKHQKLKQFKKAMLDKMFPKDGADIPEIRFKGFSGKWEEKTLGEIFDYERPDNYIVKSTEYSDEHKTPVLTANKAFILGYTNENNTFNKPSIIFDDFTLDFKFVDFPYMVKSSALKILTVKNEKLDNLEFIYNLLHTIKIEILGHARHYIGVVQPTSVYVPKIDEQVKIGNYFQKLDNQIDLLQQELQKLKNIKIASLDKMFV